MKKCSKCKLEKPLMDFPLSRTRKDGYYPYCKKCNSNIYKKKSEENPGKYNAISKKWRQDHPDDTRKADLKRNYGLTLEEYNQMFVNQNGLCLICGQTEKSGKKLSVDHNHETGKVRGLLCNSCNIGIGVFNDNLLLLLKAIRYLQHE